MSIQCKIKLFLRLNSGLNLRIKFKDYLTSSVFLVLKNDFYLIQHKTTSIKVQKTEKKIKEKEILFLTRKLLNFLFLISTELNS